MAVDVATIGSPDAFYSRLEALVQEIHEAQTADGVDRIYLPGEREWERMRQAETNGIPLPADVLEKLQLVCEALGIEQPSWLRR
jgi:LDH2 family malate/lactate/ureidoglycolate dehydrogenase